MRHTRWIIGAFALALINLALILLSSGPEAPPAPPPEGPGPVAAPPGDAAPASGPDEAFAAVIAAAEAGDFSSFHAHLAATLRERISVEELARMQRANDPDYVEMRKAFTAYQESRKQGVGFKNFGREAVFRYGDEGEQVDMVAEPGGWKVLEFE